MKKIILSFIVLALSFSVKAQSYDQEIDFGFRAGYGITNYSEFKRSDLPDGYDLRNYGWGAGAFLQLRVNHIYFQPELLFTRTSTIIAAPLQNNPSILEIGMDFNSLQLPLVIGYRTSFEKSALRFGAGPYFNFLMGTGGEYTLANVETPLPSDFYDSFNEITLGMRFNIGFDVGPLFFDVAWQSGFSRLAEEFDNLGADFTELGKERTWILAVGYKLISQKK